jgi:putative two-component system protein, hydrogenase maturation factor HypX/HoxX
VKIMLLCSAFNGLTQRVWAELRGAGHPVRVQLAGEAEAMCAAVTAHQPDLIICPFLRERVPARIWRARVFAFGRPRVCDDDAERYQIGVLTAG